MDALADAELTRAEAKLIARGVLGVERLPETPDLTHQEVLQRKQQFLEGIRQLQKAESP